jgi:hypothetical protein
MKFKSLKFYLTFSPPCNEPHVVIRVNSVFFWRRHERVNYYGRNFRVSMSEMLIIASLKGIKFCNQNFICICNIPDSYPAHFFLEQYKIWSSLYNFPSPLLWLLLMTNVIWVVGYKISKRYHKINVANWNLLPLTVQIVIVTRLLAGHPENRGFIRAGPEIYLSPQRAHRNRQCYRFNDAMHHGIEAEKVCPTCIHIHNHYIEKRFK